MTTQSAKSETPDNGVASILPRCDALDGSSLHIVPAYTEAGRFCEANCITVSDGERTAMYVPLGSELRLAESAIDWNGKRYSSDWSTYGDGAATEPEHKEAAFDQGMDTGKAQAIDAIRAVLAKARATS